jgi:serine/threonine protein kinase
VTYWLLTQTVPFPSLRELYEFIAGRIDFPKGHLRSESITNEGMAFLQKALAVQPPKRFTALTALNDPWLKDTGQVSHRDSEPQEDSLRSWRSPFDHTSTPLLGRKSNGRRAGDVTVRSSEVRGMARWRLVIGIDYGTTYTGS